MSTEQERTEARALLAQRVTEGILKAMHECPQPQLILSAVPMTLAGLAGSYVLQLLRSRTLGDGQVDELLDMMASTMRDHADPSLAAATGAEVEPSGLGKFKGWFKP